MNSVAFTAGDPVALAKVFAKWAGENAEFQFKLGIVDGKLLSVEEVKALATMPGKEELFAKLLFLINAPAQRLATVLNAAGRDLAVVLGQGVEKEKFAGEASGVASAVEHCQAFTLAAKTKTREGGASAVKSWYPGLKVETGDPEAGSSELEARSWFQEIWP